MFFHKKDSEKDVREIKEVMLEEELPSFEPKEAPLFIKVEKYHDIISTLNEMKSFVASIKQLYGIINESENVRNDALKIMRNSVQRIEKSLYDMDAELLRPRGFIGETKETEKEISHIGGSLTDLQRQLGQLRKELESLS